MSIPEISVVIATIGRSSLLPLLENIENDLSNIRSEIVVVVDNPKFTLKSDNFTSLKITKFIFPKKKLGVSAAYSLGLSNIRGNYFRIFSDDDFWIPGSGKALLEAAKPGLIVVGQTLFCDELGELSRKFPVQINRDGVFHSLYSTIIPWRRNPNYFSLVSMLFPGEVNKIPFNSQFSTKEDVIWLQSIWEIGYRFIQISGTVSKVSASLLRTVERNTFKQEMLFTKRLQTSDQTLASRYLYQHSGRAAAATGQKRYFKEILQIGAELNIKPKISDVAIFNLLRLVAFLRWINRAARNS